jgi:hypothetical protein
VAPGTLRRWTDAGRVHAFTTPGGHRRFRRSALARLVGPGAERRPRLARVTTPSARLVRAYRAEARSAARSLAWLAGIDESQREWFRSHGRRLAKQLLEHLDAPDRHQSEHHVREAEAEAAAYGRMASGLGASLSGTVEGFLHFRRPFLHELAVAARRRGFDVPATTDLLEAAERAMDRLLMAAMTAHGVERVGSLRPGRQEGAGRPRVADVPSREGGIE